MSKRKKSRLEKGAIQRTEWQTAERELTETSPTSGWLVTQGNSFTLLILCIYWNRRLSTPRSTSAGSFNFAGLLDRLLY